MPAAAPSSLAARIQPGPLQALAFLNLPDRIHAEQVDGNRSDFSERLYYRADDSKMLPPIFEGNYVIDFVPQLERACV